MLGQEPVPWMHRVDARATGDGDQLVTIEVRTDLVGLVHAAWGSLVRRMDAHHADAHGTGGPRDADRDLASVRDQEAADRLRGRRTTSHSCQRRARHAGSGADPG